MLEMDMDSVVQEHLRETLEFIVQLNKDAKSSKDESKRLIETLTQDLLVLDTTPASLQRKKLCSLIEGTIKQLEKVQEPVTLVEGTVTLYENYLK